VAEKKQLVEKFASKNGPVDGIVSKDKISALLILPKPKKHSYELFEERYLG
jgi:hypothetical protein